ncbi:succinate dehydrogenase hydrophobic anchor protein [Litoreibacter arenae]|uniref:Succinate dehydrogenase hydrophobic anchor protein n=1 Tax=Litoreibacter arenae DSM 19593 TaxID=1123360 RepID=S9QN59_9RHOB|nr:succinate dehydrogenase hydrophobic anchor protein [Litoreibacter arenae]EPX81112.1 Succinate dehydrogenase hydrophobic anchor protein [Litoreibacter arenae DSM 19593]
MTLKLYMAQRITALIMAPLVLMHIAVMIYAIQGGLSAAEILGRTQGSILWFLFYGTFVVAVSIHAAIGLRTVLSEWAGLCGTGLNAAAWTILALLLILGMQAVYGVTAT